MNTNSWYNISIVSARPCCPQSDPSAQADVCLLQMQPYPILVPMRTRCYSSSFSKREGRNQEIVY